MPGTRILNADRRACIAENLFLAADPKLASLRGAAGSHTLTPRPHRLKTQGGKIAPGAGVVSLDRSAPPEVVAARRFRFRGMAGSGGFPGSLGPRGIRPAACNGRGAGTIRTPEAGIECTWQRPSVRIVPADGERAFRNDIRPPSVRVAACRVRRASGHGAGRSGRNRLAGVAPSPPGRWRSPSGRRCQLRIRRGEPAQAGRRIRYGAPELHRRGTELCHPHPPERGRRHPVGPGFESIRFWRRAWR